MFFITDKKKAKIMEALLRESKDFELAITSEFCFEITEKGMNKSRGVQSLANHLGIDKSQIVAFGDSENDFEMLKYVGLGVAMGNASDHVKSIADYVTESNDDEGVALVIKDILCQRLIRTI